MRVGVIGRQRLDEVVMKDFLAEEGVSWKTDAPSDAEALVEVGGRLCYMSFKNPRPGGNEAYIDHIKQAGHGSVLEHAVWTLLVTGVSRSLSHELVRHRAGMSFSQLSQRFVDESEVDFVCPEIINADPELRKLWKDEVEGARSAYSRLTELLLKRYPEKGIKAIRQAARSVLPNATETKLVVTANARAIRHFIEQRGSEGADVEMRRLAGQILGAMLLEAPNLFDDYQVYMAPDGVIAIRTEYKKV